MFWLIFRTTIYILLFGTIWFGGRFYITSDLNDNLHKLTPNTLFVNQSILKDSELSQQQNGSFTYPFATINQAISFAKTNHPMTIIVNPGIYHETIVLPDETTLFGINDVIITTKREENKTIVIPKNNTSLINIILDGGNHGISIPKKTNIRLYNVTIKNAKKYALEMDKDDEKRDSHNNLTPTYDILYKTKDEISKIPLVRISKSLITQNNIQGLYLADGRVEIENTLVTHNGEEGIDLHPHLYATINNVVSKYNGESGLESEIYDNIVTITNSTFDNNLKSGVAFITHIGTGKIILTNNTITQNKKYGMRCALHKKRPTSPRPFFQTTIKRKNNIFDENIPAAISPEACYTF